MKAGRPHEARPGSRGEARAGVREKWFRFVRQGLSRRRVRRSPVEAALAAVATAATDASPYAIRAEGSVPFLAPGALPPLSRCRGGEVAVF